MMHPSQVPPHGELLRRVASTHRERIYAVVDSERITYGQLYERASAVASGMRAHGLGRGDCVGVFMPNCIEFFVIHFATQLLGAITVTINARYKSHELDHAIRHADIRMLFTTDRADEYVNFGDILRATYPDLAAEPTDARLQLCGAPRLESIVLCGSGRRAPFVSLDALIEAGCSRTPDHAEDPCHIGSIDDVAVMLFTSGTTAAPKACQLTHRGLYQSWVHSYPAAVGLSPGEKVWIPMPCFHVGGIGLAVGTLAWGATFVTSIRHDPATAWRLIRKHQVEHLYPGFFTLLLPVLREPEYDKQAIPNARSVLAVAPLETSRAMQELLPDGILMLQLFGMTEASGYVSFTRADVPEELRLSSSGKPIDGVEIRIVDPADNRPLSIGEQGEIQFRGPNAFHSYYKDPDATAATILDGGWVRTGDCGRVDAHGYLYFLGRIKDMLKVGGENVSAAEVEAYIGRHPAVKLAQVVGRPDDHYHEVVVAFVELLPGNNVSSEDIIEFCKGRLASFKVPREVRFVTEWPMSATKIQKFRLREMLEQRT